jgi:sulfate transporter 1, high-affinity
MTYARRTTVWQAPKTLSSGDLYFFNANVARSQILAQTQADPVPQAILLDLGASADLDIGTSDMLRDLTSDLRRSHVDLLLAQVRGSVRQRMRVTGLSEHIGADHIFLSVEAAVQSFLSGAVTVPALPAAGEATEGATEVLQAAV